MSTPSYQEKKRKHKLRAIQEESSSRDAKDKKVKAVKKSPTKAIRATTDSKLELLDQKWSERFNRLEALLLSKTFQPMVVSPAKLPPEGAVTNDKPFFKPQTGNQPNTSLTTDLLLPALTGYWPTYQLTITSIYLTGLRLITGLKASQRPKANISAIATGTSPVHDQKSPETDMDTR